MGATGHAIGNAGQDCKSFRSRMQAIMIRATRFCTLPACREGRLQLLCVSLRTWPARLRSRLAGLCSG